MALVCRHIRGNAQPPDRDSDRVVGTRDKRAIDDKTDVVMPGDESSIAIIPEPFRKDLDLPVLISANMAHRLARDIPPTFAPPMRLVASVGLERMLMAISVVAQVIGVSGVIESAKPELRGLAK
ncbi:hypothetical protein D3C72_1828950 [compost metagenome]